MPTGATGKVILTETFMNPISEASVDKSSDKYDGKTTIFAENSSFEGKFETPGDVRVFGNFKGTLNCREVTVEETGALDGTVDADQVSAAGTLEGEVGCKVLLVKNTAMLAGNFYSEMLGVEPGAKVKAAHFDSPDELEHEGRSHMARRSGRPTATLSHTQDKGSVTLPRKQEAPATASAE
jgi:cytoskeletal protein CcmA (bactofilin family)